MRRDAPTCGPDERLQDIRARLGDWDTCFVLDPDGVLLGRLGRAALAREDDVSAEEAMTDGPSTIRPSARLDSAVKRMDKRALSSLPVTTSAGRYLGLLTRADRKPAARRPLDSVSARPDQRSAQSPLDWAQRLMPLSTACRSISASSSAEKSRWSSAATFCSSWRDAARADERRGDTRIAQRPGDGHLREGLPAPLAIAFSARTLGQVCVA